MRRLAGVVIAIALATHAMAALPAARGASRADGSAVAAISPSPRSIDVIRFAFDAGAPIRSKPVIGRGTVYVGSTDGAMHAVDASTGHERWRTLTGGAITASAAVDADAVYVASRDGYLYCLRARDGTIRWKARIDAARDPRVYWDYYLSSPVKARLQVLIGSGDGHVYALSARTGKRLWSFDAGGRVRSTVAVDDAMAVFGTTRGEVIALRLRDGTPLWRFASQGASQRFEDQGNDTTSIMASPTFAGDVVTVGARDGFLYGLDRSSGQERWRITHDGSSWILSTAYDGASVFVASGSAQIVQAIDPASGAQRWRFATRAAVFAPLTVAGDTLLASDFSGTLYALDTVSGTLLWQFPIGSGRALSSPTASDGTVYCASDDGVLYALTTGSARSPHARDESVRRVVYIDPPLQSGAFRWFQNGVDAALTSFLTATGYRPMDAANVLALMTSPGSSRTVIVFAANHIPAAVAAGSGGTPPIRRFLDGGGKVVLLGPNPLAYVEDPNGALTGVDWTIPQAVFDVNFPPQQDIGGYYASHPVGAGRAAGLRSAFVSYPAVFAQHDLEVLAEDEYGRASAWLRHYTGDRGMGLLQLAVPRQQSADYGDLLRVIEYGIGW